MLNEDAQVNSANENSEVSTFTEEQKQLLRDCLRALPAHALEDLLSIGVCHRCLLRLFGLQEHVCFHPFLRTSVLSGLFGEVIKLGGNEVNNSSREEEESTRQQFFQESRFEPKVCKICVGILQFLFDDDKEKIKRDCPHEFAAMITEVVKAEHHQADTFSLEVSLPPIIMHNEQAIWLYMKKKYDSENWFKNKSASEHISTKDSLKFSITNSLEKLLGLKSNASSFRIRLTYIYSDGSTGQAVEEKNGCNKRRKTGFDGGFKNIPDDIIPDIELPDVQKSGSHESVKNFSKELQGNGLDSIRFQLDKVDKPCHLKIFCYRSPIYIGGRYLKYSRNVSQTRWIIDDERMGEASVEEIIGGNILPACQADNYKFHGAGREDIDVRMLGTGRPFLVEIQNARVVPSEMQIKEIEMQINSLESKYVKVKNLKVLGSQGWSLMREGEAEKQKQYAALVWISRPLDEEDLQTISSMTNTQILQKTPVRVLHRRSPLEREKIVHWYEQYPLANDTMSSTGGIW